MTETEDWTIVVQRERDYTDGWRAFVAGRTLEAACKDRDAVDCVSIRAGWMGAGLAAWQGRIDGDLDRILEWVALANPKA